MAGNEVNVISHLVNMESTATRDLRTITQQFHVGTNIMVLEDKLRCRERKKVTLAVKTDSLEDDFVWGVYCPSKKQKIQTLKYWRSKNEKRGNSALGEALVDMTKDFLDLEGDTGDSGNLPFDAICEGVVDAIEEDSWMRFVRLKLELNEREIKKFKWKHGGFSEKQKGQIPKEWMQNQDETTTDII